MERVEPMKILKTISILVVLLIGACASDSTVEEPGGSTPPDNPIPDPPPVGSGYEYTRIPTYEQRSGDPAQGYEYLISGDYMSSGIPYDAYILAEGEKSTNLLNRSGKNATVDHNLNVVTLDNGVDVVAPNCLQCHSSKINNELIVGLGNANLDFTVDRATEIQTLSTGIRILYGTESDEWDAFEPFLRSLEIAGPKTVTKVRGVNPADKTTLALIAYRDKDNLEILESPLVEVDDEVLPSDVPAWWLLKKKNALFYTAIGRNDFCRSMITMIMATLTTFEKAEEVDQRMPDILSFVNTIEPPDYPFEIDEALAETGRSVFVENCATCHGTYGQNASYPNKLVSLKTIGTDPALSDFYSKSSLQSDYMKEWFNKGWFGKGNDALYFEAEGGYIAPPLDGVWATAPYFHNGSVPTIEDVLNSPGRPAYWTRSFNSSDYDSSKVGWNYVKENGPGDKNTYNTTLKGYGNQGHTFGDSLSEEERNALLEYLKTL